MELLGKLKPASFCHLLDNNTKDLIGYKHCKQRKPRYASDILKADG